MTRPKMFLLFFVIAFGGSSAIAFLFPGAWAEPTGQQKAVQILYMMAALFATLVVQGPVLRAPVLKPLGVTFSFNRWWVAAWLAPVVVLGVGVAVGAALGYEPVLDGAAYLARKRAALPPEMLAEFDEAAAQSPPGSPLMFIGPGLLSGVTLNLLFGLALEVGWRGFLFREIQGGFWRRSILIGLAEAIFWAPAVALGLYYAAPSEGLGLNLLWCLAASPVLVYLRVRCRSVVPVAAFRGTIFALTATAADLTTAPALVRPFQGAGGIVGLLVVLGLLWIHDRRFAERRLMGAAE